MIAGSLPEKIEELGAALEMLHTYSLIHDDLPALDNDDLRRGRPPVTKYLVTRSQFSRETLCKLKPMRYWLGWNVRLRREFESSKRSRAAPAL